MKKYKNKQSKVDKKTDTLLFLQHYQINIFL